MSVYEGVYKSLLQGVSQQTPQEREDGQLSEQINMLSDPVTGLRRRSGFKYYTTATPINPDSYIRIVELGGVLRIVAIDPVTGNVYVFSDFNASTPTWTVLNSSYLQAQSKGAFRTCTARGDFFIVNTERVPKKVVGTSSTRKDPSKYGYFSVLSSAFSKSFYINVKYGSYTYEATITTHENTANQASPEYVAEKIEQALSATAPAAVFNVYKEGTTVAIEAKDKNNTFVLEATTSVSPTFMVASGMSTVLTKSALLGKLPSQLDGYSMTVGNTGNASYFQYSSATGKWTEVGVYEKDYNITEQPRYIRINDVGVPTISSLGISKRLAGDDDNNPLPKFIGYGITGIAAYQSRLVLLSGAYINMSQTTEFNQFMRTTVTELLDDDAIEISSASLSSAQFEYAIPYNKDLVLIAQGQQAVIPANSTVLTPKTAVVYPSTKLDLSLAAEPVAVSRTLYYAYQRGAEFYQVGEFIPNTYTDAQYYAQNLTDHIPLYAKGVCTTIAASTTNNMVVMCSDSNELLVNQYLWRGDERPLMSFHKWVYPYKVVYAQFLQEFLVLFMENDAGELLIGTTNVQLNQLDDKPVPYIDNYQYVTITDGVGTLPANMPTEDLVATIYDSVTARHSEVMFTLEGNTITCPYDGEIVLGLRYESTFGLTPPFVRDNNGKVITGTRTTLHSLRMTFKSTGFFNVLVQDTMGAAYEDERTAYTWSEVDLGYTWINSIGSVVIPCRTRLSSTDCSVSTTGCTDMNLVSTEYVLRTASKRRRL